MRLLFPALLSAALLAVPVAAPLAAPLAAQANTAAQTPVQSDTPTIKNDARLVVIPTVVRDKHGAFLGDLTRENFALTVDDAPQPLRYFDHDADAALTLGLLVDTSRSQTSVLDDERAASLAFLQTAVSPGRDQAFIMQFARTVDLLQDVTDSRPRLQQALQQLDTTAPSQPDPHDSQTDPDANQDARGGHRRGGFGGGTALYDAVYLAAHEVLPRQKARRAVILLTDGVDSGSKTTLPGAIEAAQRADTIVYAIYYKGEEHHDYGGGGGHGGGFPGGGGGYPGGRGGGGRGGGGGQDGQGGGGGRGGGERVDGKKVLERLCGETGGRVFAVSKKDTVARIYSEIGAELRAQYRLGFTPTGPAAAEGYHTLAISLVNRKDKNEQAQARDGYYTR